MGESPVQNFLTPLTLDAKLFLNSLENTPKQDMYFDINLCDVLENIVTAIERLLDRKEMNIVHTERTKLVPLKDLSQISRIYFCNQCKIDLGKSNQKAVEHLINFHYMKAKKKEARKQEREELRKQEALCLLNNKVMLPLPKKATGLFNGDILKIFNDNLQVAEKLKHIPDYEIIESELLATMAPLFPGLPIRLYKFGSRITGTASRNSDLDIFVDIGNTSHIYEHRASVYTIGNLKLVCNGLRKSPQCWTQIMDVSKARVPILKVCHAQTTIECDIGFSNSLGFFNTKMMAYLFDMQPMARRMCIFLKKWLERTLLSETISTYSISLMVVFFMQVHKYLPSIQQLQEGSLGGVVCVGPWIASFMQKSLKDFNYEKMLPKSPQQCNFILKVFFDFYGKFDFENYVVCPYYGEAVPIKDLEQRMPQRYIDYIAKEKDHAIQLKKGMIVQDPMELNHNVTKGVCSNTLKMFRDFCNQSSLLIQV